MIDIDWLVVVVGYCDDGPFVDGGAGGGGGGDDDEA
jgi:hypothetical protein